MSRYPGNPYWHEASDRPLMIESAEAWEEAEAGGHITAEHVLMRLRGMAVHASGLEGPIGYDEDGFVISLVAGCISIEGGVRLCVYPRDHPPPHVHILVNADRSLKMRINLLTGEFMDKAPADWAKTGKKMSAAVTENRSKLIGMWESYHGPVCIG